MKDLIGQNTQKFTIQKIVFSKNKDVTENNFNTYKYSLEVIAVIIGDEAKR